MKYLNAFMARISNTPGVSTGETGKIPGRVALEGGENSGIPRGRLPAKPAKPRSGGSFAGFAGGGSQETQNFTGPSTMHGPEPSPGEWSEPRPTPPWRAVVSSWPIARRQEWADLAAVHEAAGMSWREAEGLAFAAIAEEATR